VYKRGLPQFLAGIKMLFIFCRKWRFGISNEQLSYLQQISGQIRGAYIQQFAESKRN
jgi:hypothetical protein